MLSTILILALATPPGVVPADTFVRDAFTITARTGSVKTTTTKTQSFTTRAPHGHTHTCRFCGLQQWVQDPQPRPVHVLKSAASSVRKSGCPD